MANDEVGQHLKGGQEQVVGPQVDLQGQKDQAWGMSHPDAALHATGVQHIYLIMNYSMKFHTF